MQGRYADVLLYTAKGTEFEITRDELRTEYGVVLKSVALHAGTLLEGSLHGMRIVLASGSRQGPEVCAATVTSLLHALSPRRIVMVGMCAGNPAKKYSIGDALMGLTATNINEGKVTEDGMLKTDDRTVNAHESIGMYIERLEQKNLAKKVTFMSGSAVVEDNSINWGAKGRDSHAYDMEASAFLTAVEHYNATSPEHKVIALGVCKGVADTGDAASRGGDKKANQTKSVRAAVLAVTCLLKWIHEDDPAPVVDAVSAYARASKSVKDAKDFADACKESAMRALSATADKLLPTGLSDSAYKYAELTEDQRDVKRWPMANVCKLFAPEPAPAILVKHAKDDEAARGTATSIAFRDRPTTRPRRTKKAKHDDAQPVDG